MTPYYQNIFNPASTMLLCVMDFSLIDIIKTIVINSKYYIVLMGCFIIGDTLAGIFDSIHKGKKITLSRLGWSLLGKFTIYPTLIAIISILGLLSLGYVGTLISNFIAVCIILAEISSILGHYFSLRGIKITSNNIFAKLLIKFIDVDIEEKDVKKRKK